MVHSSLIACIKMGVYLTKPKQLASIPLLGHTKILHMLVCMDIVLLLWCCCLNFVQCVRLV